jgi:hypothetical protein
MAVDAAGMSRHDLKELKADNAAIEANAKDAGASGA